MVWRLLHSPPQFFPLPGEELQLAFPDELTSRPVPDIGNHQDLSLPANTYPPAAFHLLFSQPEPVPSPLRPLLPADRECGCGFYHPESWMLTLLPQHPSPTLCLRGLPASLGNADCVTWLQVERLEHSHP
ncbi:hypothetical protein HJG60_011506 [Phyllostomus discolor]|uniref:Uncharacterized protein n=1 Tax=Phyllostomus discolor TaxID=89673 RepID=A0A834E0V6_9CHIR|nr:hypothetical protein HJG60_011506 [Phyllostomus discolor]